MYSNSWEASMSLVAHIIECFRGRQVAMAILRQIEKESGEFDSAIDASSPGKSEARLSSLTNSSTGHSSRRETKVIWLRYKVTRYRLDDPAVRAAVEPRWWLGTGKSGYAL
jgi:hypothetical protein